MFNENEKQRITECYKEVYDKITKEHIGCFQGHTKPVFLISAQYPGVWLEHAYDSVFFAQQRPEYLELAKNTLNLFLDNQRPDGQLPCYVLDESKSQEYREVIGFSQTQECVSFARLCLRYYRLSGDREFLEKAYAGCAGWAGWQRTHRALPGEALLRVFGGFDTGHDHSGRWDGVKYDGDCRNGDAACLPEDDRVLPLIAPDMNAVYYGTLSALAAMAEELGREAEAKQWLADAEKVREALLEACYDPEDVFFYDVDRNGEKRRYLSISITNVLSEGMLDKEMADAIYRKHLRNGEEFWTPYPFPSMARSDRSFVKNKPGNSWGYYSQALTILRCTFWMDALGKSGDFDQILEKWVRQWAFSETIRFGQELDPITGEPSESSEWYSSCMLVYLYAVERLGLLAP